jgi:WD40 repeat protein
MEISSSVQNEIRNDSRNKYNVTVDISNNDKQNKLSDPILHFDERFILTSNLEVCKSLKDKFLKSFQFSPDGTSVLTTTEDNYFQIYEIDESIIEEKKYYKQSLSSSFSSNPNNYLYSKNKIMAGESIFDSKWYPFANSSDPNSFCFVSTCRSHPIQLWDANIGKVRCSYRGHNHLDELDTANCVSFNLTGNRIYAGSKSMIRFYDVANPGCNYTNIPTCKSKKDLTGQKGIISCLAFNPDYSGAFAAGSYSNNVGIYVEDMKGCALQINDLECGVTHMKWSPNGCNLWIGGRGSDSIVCWDVRNTREEIGRVNRSLNTNQRLSFDLDPWGKYLITGSQDGK